MRVTVFPALSIVALMAACADLTKYQTEAAGLVKEYSTQIASLTQGTTDLLQKVQGLPAGVPGLADLLGKLKANQATLGALQSDVSGFGTKLAEAIKGGKESDVQGLIADLKNNVGGKLATLSTGMKDLTSAVAAAEKAAEALKAPPADAPAGYAKTLADGYALKASVGGIEQGLIEFIEDGAKQVDKTTWFNFDRLVFKTGSAELDMEKSKEQLENVAEILKVFPKVNLKVGGYTDNQGDAKANQKLSAARAEAVAKDLVAHGIAAKRLDPEGYGAEHPVCAANDTDECRAQNRRISVRVTAK